MHPLFVLEEIIFLLFCTIAIAANILIVYTILRYNGTRRPPYIYIAFWSFLDIFNLLINPAVYGMTMVWKYMQIPWEFMIFFYEIGFIIHTAVIFAVFVLVLDYCLAAYYERCSQKIRPWNKFIIGAVLLCLVTTLIIVFAVCKSRNCIALEFVIIISYGALSLFVIILLSIRGIQKCRGRSAEYPLIHLNLATIFVLSWGVGFSNIIILRWLIAHPMATAALDCVTFCSPVANIVLLYKFDDEYQAYFRQALRCSNNRYHEPTYRFNNPLVVNNQPIESPLNVEEIESS